MATVPPLRRAPPRQRLRGLRLAVAGGIAAAAALVLALLLGPPRDGSQPQAPIAREAGPQPPALPDVVEMAPVQIAEVPSAAADSSAQLAGLDRLPDEDLALVLELDAVKDLDLVANLDLLEALVDLGMVDGA
jgi:hypothetical protein